MLKECVYLLLLENTQQMERLYFHFSIMCITNYAISVLLLIAWY